MVDQVQLTKVKLKIVEKLKGVRLDLKQHPPSCFKRIDTDVQYKTVKYSVLYSWKKFDYWLTFSNLEHSLIWSKQLWTLRNDNFLCIADSSFSSHTRSTLSTASKQTFTDHCTRRTRYLIDIIRSLSATERNL